MWVLVLAAAADRQVSEQSYLSRCPAAWGLNSDVPDLFELSLPASLFAPVREWGMTPVGVLQFDCCDAGENLRSDWKPAPNSEPMLRARYRK